MTFFSFEKKKRKFSSIAIVGCGTLGSALAFLLAKKGIAKRLLLIDGDKVEEKNISNQIYSRRDIGRYKVEALRDVIEEYVEVECLRSLLTPYNLRVLDKEDVVIDTTDSLYVIKNIFPSLSHNLLGFLKIRGTEGMFGIIDKKREFLDVMRSKRENAVLLPVRLESSFLLCSLFIHALSYGHKSDKIFFVNLTNISKIIEEISL